MGAVVGAAGCHVDRHVADEPHAPVGRMGGQPGATSAPWFRLRGEKVTLPMVSKGENVRITQGDIICMLTPGGGGYGDPARRSKQAIAGDIEAGYATSD